MTSSSPHPPTPQAEALNALREIIWDTATKWASQRAAMEAEICRLREALVAVIEDDTNEGSEGRWYLGTSGKIAKRALTWEPRR